MSLSKTQKIIFMYDEKIRSSIENLRNLPKEIKPTQNKVLFYFDQVDETSAYAEIYNRKTFIGI